MKYKHKCLTFVLVAVEWVGKKEGERDVYVTFDDNTYHINITDRVGKILRTIDLKKVHYTILC